MMDSSNRSKYYEEMLEQIERNIDDKIVRQIAKRMLNRIDFCMSDLSLVRVEADSIFGYAYFNIDSPFDDLLEDFQHWLDINRLTSSLMGYKREYDKFDERLTKYLLELRRKERMQNLVVSMSQGIRYKTIKSVLSDEFLDEQMKSEEQDG